MTRAYRQRDVGDRKVAGDVEVDPKPIGCLPNNRLDKRVGAGLEQLGAELRHPSGHPVRLEVHDQGLASLRKQELQVFGLKRGHALSPPILTIASRRSAITSSRRPFET